MRRFDELTRVGFGAYRAFAGIREHEEALHHALAVGCNLVDTAASYGGGRSELLIGDAIRHHRGVRPFVITKAGYGGAGHSMAPDFLRAQLKGSRQRLGMERIDGFLLHNPEHWFEGTAARDDTEFYAQIERSFEFLEESVDAGVIDCYGVSSNTLPLPSPDPPGPRLPRLLEAARRVASDPRFLILEFPFNIVEQQALEPQRDGESLIAMGRSEGLRLVGNRTLNAVTRSGILRLATFDPGLEQLDQDADERRVGAALGRLEARINALDMSGDRPSVLDYLEREWAEIPSPDAVGAVFAGHVWPLIARCYPEEPPEAEKRLFADLQGIVITYAQRNLARAAARFRAQLVALGELAESDPRPLEQIACERALGAGLDHVLVGMRRVGYVERLRPLLTAKRGANRWSPSLVS